jgi:Ricin-type beta-trefoil lectin domain-like
MLLSKSSKHTIQQRLGFVSAAVVATVASIGFASAQTQFVIASVSSGQVLDVPAFSLTPGAKIQQWPANGFINQQWRIRRISNRYQILSNWSGQALDVPAFSTAIGTQIQQWPSNGLTNQQWTITRSPGSSGYEIVSADQGGAGCGDPFCFPINLALDVPAFSTTPGAKIQQWGENDLANQQWLFNPTNGSQIVAFGNGDTVTLVKSNFVPFSEVCWAFNVGPTDYAVIGSCTIVNPGGIFIAGAAFLSGSRGNYHYENGPNQTVVTAEDTSGNVLAIGTLQGGWQLPALPPPH